ncbi:MAG: MarR family winged helix-turn-helix transcriptional regulator, partial [Mycobacteriaceae bacterium]
MTDALALNRQVCFALYSASRETTAAYRSMLDRLGVTYPQYLVLLVLWEQDGRGVHDICEALNLDTGTVSPLLKRLESMGLIK